MPAQPPPTPPLPPEIQRVRKIAALYAVIYDLLLEVKQIPEGHIYAHICGRCTLEEFQTAVNLLVSSKRATSKNHLLTLIEPTKAPERKKG
jgi:hypothetical protein